MKKISVFSIAYIEIFAWAIGAATVALMIASIFFRDQFLLVATGLTAVALIFEMDQLLAENRDAIWVYRRSSWEANTVLVMKIVAVFLGVFLVTMAFQALGGAPGPYKLAMGRELFSNQAYPLFFHNLRVLFFCMVLAFLYRSAGILLVICWNAMNWSGSLFSFLASASSEARNAWLYSLAVLPHLFLEAAAYVAAGMTGVFLSKALFKYKMSSDKFFRVSRACVAILAVSVALLWLAMELETGLAQKALERIRG